MSDKSKAEITGIVICLIFLVGAFCGYVIGGDQ